MLIGILIYPASPFNFYISSVSAQYWAQRGFLMTYRCKEVKLSSSADLTRTMNGKTNGEFPLWVYVILSLSILCKSLSSSFCHFLLLLLKVNFIKTSQIKTALSRASQVPFIMVSYLVRRSAWEGSLAIRHIQSPSLSYQWLIHQTFIFCPLSTVSLCLSLPSLWCCERERTWGLGENFFLPQLFPSRSLLLIRFYTWALEFSPKPALQTLHIWPHEVWDGLPYLHWTFLLNDVMIEETIKDQIGWKFFSPITHFRAENVEKEETCKMIESSLPNLQKSKEEPRAGQRLDWNIAGR